MTFLSPLLLAGLAAAAVPILLHLLRRQERRTLVFPALRYLKRTTREHARIVRLRQLLLLAIRIAAVIVAVLAGARLVLPLGGTDDPPAAVALVVDNGLTSAAIVGESRVLDSLAARAGEILDRTGPRDQVWVVPAGSPWEAVVSETPSVARARVAELEPTHVTVELADAISRAASLVSASDLPFREVLLLSDLRDASVDPANTTGADTEVPVRIVPPPSVASANRGVAGLQISGGVTPRAGDLAELQVQVVGTGVEGSIVRVYLLDGLVGTATVGPGGIATVPLPRMDAGWMRGRVELEPDDLRADDIAWFAFRATPEPTVEVLGTVPGFVEEALTVLQEADRIDLEGETPADIAILAPPLPARAPTEPALVVLPPADPALLPALNRLLADILPGWSVSAAESAGSARRLDGGALIDLISGQPVVRSAHVLHPPERGPGFISLLTLSDGSPWAVETETADGRPVVLLASPMTSEATDLPTSASMVPLMEILTGRLADGVPGEAARAGEPLPIPDGATGVRAPDGQARTLDGSSAFTETGAAGIYAFTDAAGDTVALAAVNPEPAIPAYGLDAATAASRLSGLWPRIAVADPWPASVLRDRRGREMGRPLLALLFLLLLTEGWLATAADRGSRAKRAAEGGRSEAGAGGPTAPDAETARG